MKAASSGKKSPADVCEGVEFRGNTAGFDSILTPEAVAFVAGLHREFNARRRQLLEARKGRQRRLDAGEMPDFLPETANIRESDWQVAPIPADLQDRRVEITGPPRGWHLDECHMLWEGEPVSASLFDFGLFFFHNTKKLVDRGSGPYLRSENSPPFLRGGQGGLDN